MSAPPSVQPRRKGRGLRPWLIASKLIGLVGFLGGLAALGAMGLFGPTPQTQGQWMLLRDLSRAVFFPCVFWGLVVVFVSGLLLFARQPRVFLKLRWFRTKLLLLVVFVPSTHLWARGHVTRMYEAIEQGRLADAQQSYGIVSIAYVVTAVIFCAIAVFARHKPRLGERIGRRNPKRSPVDDSQQRVGRPDGERARSGKRAVPARSAE